MKKFFEKLGDGVVKEWGMIVALVLLAMPPMLCSKVFLGGIHSFLVNGYSEELFRQIKFPIIDMGILMLLILLVVELVHFVDKKWFRWIIYGFSILLATVRVWLWWVFGMRISPSAFQLLMETNSQESREFFQEYLFGVYGIGLVGIVIGLIALCLLLEWLNKNAVIKGVWKKIVIVTSVFCVVWGFIEMRWMVKLLRCEDSKDFYGLLYQIEYDRYDGGSNSQALLFAVVGYNCGLEDINYCIANVRDIYRRKNEVTCDKDSLLVVFVLGESYIKSHCGLYGYERNTTPLLEKEKRNDNLYAFNDVVTPFPKTSEVIKSIFFTYDVPKKWYKSVFFPQLFKLGGYKVDIWNNQNANVGKKWLIFDSSNILYSDDIKSYSYTSVSQCRFNYDGKMIDEFAKRKSNEDCNRLVIFHLKGQHFDASSRFPHTKDNMVFKGTDKKSNEIATYDNACVYNDKVIAQIINLVRDKKSVVVYFSDHGEEVYDYRNSCGRKAAEPGLEKEFLKYQAEVPFMIWCSDKYKEAYPEIVKDIEVSLDKPFITSNVCHIMFHLAGIKSPWYKEERDLLSDKYKCERRIVDGRYDYDAIMSR